MCVCVKRERKREIHIWKYAKNAFVIKNGIMRDKREIGTVKTMWNEVYSVF